MKRISKILLISGILAGIMSLGIWWFSPSHQSQMVANAFLNDFITGNVDGIKSKSTSALQENLKLEDTTGTDSDAKKDDDTKVEFIGYTKEGDRVAHTGKITKGDTNITFGLKLVKEKRNWKVDAVFMD